MLSDHWSWVEAGNISTEETELKKILFSFFFFLPNFSAFSLLVLIILITHCSSRQKIWTSKYTQEKKSPCTPYLCLKPNVAEISLKNILFLRLLLGDVLESLILKNNPSQMFRAFSLHLQVRTMWGEEGEGTDYSIAKTFT